MTGVKEVHGDLIIDPISVGGDEVGQNMTSDIEWACVGEPTLAAPAATGLAADEGASRSKEGRRLVAAQFEVEGGKQLRKSLKDVEDGLADLKDAHGDVAQIVADAARPGAPRQTGRLAGSIRPSGTKTMAIVRAGGAKVPYAGVQEWGWGRRNIPAQPYIVPAAHDTESTWVARYKQTVDDLLGKVKGA